MNGTKWRDRTLTEVTVSLTARGGGMLQKR